MPASPLPCPRLLPDPAPLLSTLPARSPDPSGSYDDLQTAAQIGPPRETGHKIRSNILQHTQGSECFRTCDRPTSRELPPRAHPSCPTVPQCPRPPAHGKALAPPGYLMSRHWLRRRAPVRRNGRDPYTHRDKRP